MSITLPKGAASAFETGRRYALDDSLTLGYAFQNTDHDHAQSICDEATESYARVTLHWPKGRLAKPDIFHVVDDASKPFKTLEECAEHFIQHLQSLYETSPPKQLQTYPHAFVALTQKGDADTAILAMAYEVDGEWRMDHRTIPIHNELGLEVSSLCLGDTSAEDILRQYQATTAEN